MVVCTSSVYVCPPRFQAIAGLGSFRARFCRRCRFRSPDVTVTSVTSYLASTTGASDTGMYAASVLWAVAPSRLGPRSFSAGADEFEIWRPRRSRTRARLLLTVLPFFRLWRRGGRLDVLVRHFVLARPRSRDWCTIDVLLEK